MNKKIKIIFLLLLVIIITTVLINWINKEIAVSEEEQALSQVFTLNVPLKELLITEEMVSPGYKSSGPNLVRTRRDHGDEIDVAFFKPTSGNNGILYQEVTKFPNAYRASQLVYVTPNFPDFGWVSQEEYQIPIDNHADQWLFGCQEDLESPSISCALVARYKDIVITIESSFNPEDYSSKEFVNLAKLIDEKAYKLIMD